VRRPVHIVSGLPLLSTVSETKTALLADTKPCRRQPGRPAWFALLCGLVIVSGCRRKHFPQYPSDFREYAWVTNGGGNSVTVFDLVHMQTAATIPVGDDPTEIAVSPTRNEVYVVNAGARR